jgi:sigma-B regulation protein RsbU (phosphoserine phosphatase)
MRIKNSLPVLSTEEPTPRIPDFSFPSAFPELLEGAQSIELSGPPQVDGLDYYGERKTADQIGGDFFDFVPLLGQRLLMSIGDVSRHGIGATVIMSGLQATLRSLAAEERGELPELVRGLNRSICDLAPDNFYATLFYGRIDPVPRQLRYVSAGHEPALLFHRKSKRLRRLERTGTVLGLTARAIYRQHTVSMEAGDTLVAFTDGITEATDSRGREFREQGVLRVLEDYPEAGARELGIRILEAVEGFQPSSAAGDDRTVVVVRLVDATAAHPIAEHAEELAMAAA